MYQVYYTETITSYMCILCVYIYTHKHTYTYIFLNIWPESIITTALWSSYAIISYALVGKSRQSGIQ